MIMSAHPTKRRVITELLVIALLLAIGTALEIHFVHEPVFYILIRATIVVVWLVSGLFVGYFNRSNWRRYPSTRALMSLAVSIWLTLTMTMVNWLTPDFHGRDSLRLLIYAFVAYSIVRIFLTLRTEQRRATRLVHLQNQVRLERERIASEN